MSSPPGIALGARTLPSPTSISEEAQAVLHRLVGADGVPVNSWHVMPPPEDHDAWRQLQATVDAQYATAMAGLAGTLRAQVETIAAGTATIHVATPEAADHPERATLDFHGGALVLGGGEACRASARMQADRHQAICYGVDYRLPPAHPFPAALEDGLAAYRFALDRHRPQDIVVGGRSAGGNLAVATLLRARAAGLPMPAGLVLLSPELDLTESGDSFAVNAGIDVALPGSLMAANLLYAGGADLAHPDLSPLFAADLAGLPPTFLQSGTRDLFLSNAVRFHRRLRAAGVAAELHVFEAMPHGGFGGGTPEDRDLAAEVTRFVAACWPR
jgi:monoterpene epsilon-lactone hydrolase